MKRARIVTCRPSDQEATVEFVMIILAAFPVWASCGAGVMVLPCEPES